MDVRNLVHMANRIGEFFEAQPDRVEAKHGIAQHIRNFWEPRMRRRLLAHVDQGAAPELSDLVREALKEQRLLLLPTITHGPRKQSIDRASPPPGTHSPGP